MITCQFEDGNIASPGLRHVTTSNIIIKDNKVLFVLRQKVANRIMLEEGKWGLPGGFFDRNESLIEAVKREVMEETGWEIDDLELFRINDNPGRPKEDRQNIDFIFIAKAINRPGSHDAEVREVKWFPLDSLPPIDQIAFDHGEDLELYLKYLKVPMTLPILG